MIRTDVTAVILAGGAGRRLGGAVKPLLVVDGQRILDRQLALLGPRVAEVIVSTQGEAPWSPVRVVRDAAAGQGPLAGLAAGLATTTTPWIVVVAGDMPWIAPAVVDAILAATAADAHAVVPRVGGYPEPLVAAYHRSIRPIVDAALAAGERSPSRLLSREQPGLAPGLARGELVDLSLRRDAVRVRWIEEAELRALDPTLRTFTSVNEPEDLAR